MCLLIYQQTSAIKTLFILKMVSFESLAGNHSSEWGAQVEAPCERNLNRQSEVLDKKYRVAVQGIFVGIIKKASGAGLKVTDLCLPSLFVKNKPGKLVSSLVNCLLFVNFD